MKIKRENDKDESSDVGHRCGRIRSSVGSYCNGNGAEGILLSILLNLNNQKWEDLMGEGKSFEISRHQVLEAYKRVKSESWCRWR